MNIFGTGVIRDFAFAMNVGVIVGTYSSIFVAAPILIWLNHRFFKPEGKDLKKSPGSANAEQEGARLKRLVLALALILAACAATRSGPTKTQLGYLKTHPLSPDEERRLYAREAQARRHDSIACASPSTAATSSAATADVADHLR